MAEAPSRDKQSFCPSAEFWCWKSAQFPLRVRECAKRHHGAAAGHAAGCVSATAARSERQGGRHIRETDQQIVVGQASATAICLRKMAHRLPRCAGQLRPPRSGLRVLQAGGQWPGARAASRGGRDGLSSPGNAPPCWWSRWRIPMATPAPGQEASHPCHGSSPGPPPWPTPARCSPQPGHQHQAEQSLAADLCIETSLPREVSHVGGRLGHVGFSE